MGEERLFVERLGDVAGPFSETEVRAGFAYGRFDLHDLVSDGGRWQPLGRRFRDLSPSRGWLWLVILAVMAGIANTALFIFAPDWLAPDGDERKIGSLAALGVVGSLVVTVVVRSGWRLSPRHRVLAAIGLLGTAALQAGGGAQVVVNTMRFRQAVGEHTLESIEPGRLRLSGNIGVGLESDLRKALEGEPGSVVLELSNAGGALDAAVKSAELLERRRGVTTRVIDECDSSCVAVFAAGNPMQMHFAAAIGLHRPVDAHSGIALPSEESQPYLDRLRAAGLGEAILAAVSTVPPDDLAYFNPVVHRESLLRVEVVDDAGNPLERTDAIVALLARWLTDTGDSTAGALAEILALVNLGFPSHADRYAEALLDAQLVDDIGGSQDVMDEFVSTAVVQAMPMSSGQAIRRLQALSFRTTSRALEQSDFERCGIVDPADQEELMDARRAVLRAARDGGWRRAVPADPDRFDRFREIVRASPRLKNVPPDEFDPLTAHADCAIEATIAEALLSLRDEDLPGVMSNLAE